MYNFQFFQIRFYRWVIMYLRLMARELLPSIKPHMQLDMIAHRLLNDTEEHLSSDQLVALKKKEQADEKDIEIHVFEYLKDSAERWTNLSLGRMSDEDRAEAENNAIVLKRATELIFGKDWTYDN